MLNKTFPTSLISAFLALPAAAQSSVDSLKLAPMTVTATSREQPVTDVQASVQVISAQDLAGFAGTSVTEALKMAAGVDARANGSSAFIAIRGFISNAGSPVLLLIDGLRRTGKYGALGLNLIGLESVERIEIVRGPMSALYGADATGGVVNIITKVPRVGDAANGSVYLTAGQLGDGQRQTSILGANVNLGTVTTGHRFTVEQRNRGQFRYNSGSTLADLNDIDETYFNYDGLAQLAPGHQLRWGVENVEQNDTGPGLTRTNASFLGFEKERRNNYALRYAAEVGHGLLNVDLAQGNSKASTTRSFPTIETTDYTQTQLNARYTLDFERHTLVVGTGVTQDDLNVSIVPRPAQSRNKHVMVQDEWRINNQWKLLGGVRYDDFSTFGSATTPRISLGFDPTGPWSFRVGYGEAFRAPAVLEQYASFLRGRFLILGNPALQPETNKTWEVATVYRDKGLEVDWTLFSSDVGNLIQSVQSPRVAGDPPAVTTRSIYTNIGRAALKGSELNAAWGVNSVWSITAGWDFLDASDAVTGSRLTQRARNTYRLGARFEQSPWRLDIQGRALKGYYASNSVTPPTPTPAPIETDFATADIKLNFVYSPALSLSFGIDNLFDQRQPSNYSATGSIQDPPGRFFHVGARYKF